MIVNKSRQKKNCSHAKFLSAVDDKSELFSARVDNDSWISGSLLLFSCFRAVSPKRKISLVTDKVDVRTLPDEEVERMMQVVEEMLLNWNTDTEDEVPGECCVHGFLPLTPLSYLTKRNTTLLLAWKNVAQNLFK